MTGKKLMRWRQQNGLTQAELGEALGLQENTIYTLESGIRGISASRQRHLEALAHYWKLTPPPISVARLPRRRSAGGTRRPGSGAT